MLDNVPNVEDHRALFDSMRAGLSVPQRSTDFTEFQAIVATLRRRFVPIVMIGALTALGAAPFILRYPNYYASKALLKVEESRLPKSFEHAGVIAPSMSEVIGSLREEFFARDALESFVRDLGLYEPRARTSGFRSYIDSVFAMSPLAAARQHIQIEIVERRKERFLDVSVRAQDPKRASQAVVQVIAALEERNRDRQLGLADEVSAFLDGELVKAHDRRTEALGRLVGAKEDVVRAEQLAISTADVGARIDSLREITEARRLQLDALTLRVESARVEATRLMPRVNDDLKAAHEIDRLRIELAKVQALDRELAVNYTTTWPRREALRLAEAELTRRLAASEQEHAASVQRSKAARAALRHAFDSGDADDAIAELLGLEQIPGTIAPVLSLIRTIRHQFTQLQAVQTRELAELGRLEQVLAKQVARDAANAAHESPYERSARVERLSDEYEAAGSAYKDLQRDRAAVDQFRAAEKGVLQSPLRVLESPSIPSGPAGPNRMRWFLLALAAGLGAGAATAIAFSQLRPMLSTKEELELAVGLRTLAVVPDAPGRSHAATPTTESGRVKQDQLDRLRHAIRHAPDRPDIRSILLTSALAGEGKSTITIGLARSYARSLNTRVLVIEADLRNPTLEGALGLPRARGLADYMASGVGLDEVVRTVPGLDGFELISAGLARVDAATLIASEQFSALVDKLKQDDAKRIVILDAPPVLATPEPLSLAALADAIVLVVRASHTPRKSVVEAIRALPSDKLLGTVFNRARIDWGHRGNYVYSAQVGPAQSGTPRSNSASTSDSSTANSRRDA